MNNRCKDKESKPLVVPKIKPRNFLGLKRRGTIRHKDKRNNPQKILHEIQD